MLINGRTPLVAGASNNNFFAGTFIEFLPGDGVLQFGFTQGDLDAVTAADIEVDIFVGNDVCALNFNPKPTGTAGILRTPIFPDDFLLSCAAVGGDRLIGKVRNLDAANAAALYWTVMLDVL